MRSINVFSRLYRDVQPLLRAWARPISTHAALLSDQEPQGLVPPQPGTVPEYSQHIFLRTPWPVTPTPSSCPWPPVVETEPFFYNAFRKIAGLQQVAKDVGEEDINVKVTAYSDDAAPPPADGTCDVLIYPDGVRYRGLSPPELQGALELHTLGTESRASVRRLLKKQEMLGGLQLFVCCHGSRDARCGARGPPLVAALRAAVRELGLQAHVTVYACSHVGGHKYAGNVLVYGARSPCDGDWFGGLHEDVAADFLRALVHVEVDAEGGGAADEVLRPYWRGRMGLPKEEAAALHRDPQAWLAAAAATAGEGSDGGSECEGSDWEDVDLDGLSDYDSAYDSDAELGDSDAEPGGGDVSGGVEGGEAEGGVWGSDFDGFVGESDHESDD